MDNARLAFLFNCYILQTCSEDEKNEFLRLVAASESDPQLKNMMRDLWDSSDHEQILPAARSEKILQTILKGDERIISIGKNSGMVWLKRAAALLIFAISLGALYYYLGSGKIQSQANLNTSLPSEHKIIKLADGSVITLNSESSLDYPESFDGRASREVFLKGEGYFDIQHDPEKPFIVHTGQLKTTVLGTAFNIKAYTHEKNITVTVTRGKVKVSDDKNILGTITPNQQITFNTESQQSIRRNVDSRNFVTWTDRDIFFDDITVLEAVNQLEQRFNVKIRLGNEKLKDCRFTATFVRGEELDQMLTVICEFKEKEILIEGNGCR
jgi:ferric-dicitrate binding protein FerR (iron transport regulator)